jgi:hypothetical protein
MTTSPRSSYKKRAIPMASRRAVAERFGCRPGERIVVHCPCGAEGTIHWFPLSSGRPGAWVHFGGLHLDHVIPERHGGSSEPENLTLLCRRCNLRKGAKV